MADRRKLPERSAGNLKIKIRLICTESLFAIFALIRLILIFAVPFVGGYFFLFTFISLFPGNASFALLGPFLCSMPMAPITLILIALLTIFLTVMLLFW